MTDQNANHGKLGMCSLVDTEIIAHSMEYIATNSTCMFPVCFNVQKITLTGLLCQISRSNLQLFRKRAIVVNANFSNTCKLAFSFILC